MTVVIVTVVIVTVVIVTIFSKNNFNILTTEEIFEGQRFAILAMFYRLLTSNKVSNRGLIIGAPDPPHPPYVGSQIFFLV